MGLSASVASFSIPFSGCLIPLRRTDWERWGDGGAWVARGAWEYAAGTWAGSEPGLDGKKRGGVRGHLGEGSRNPFLPKPLNSAGGN